MPVEEAEETSSDREVHMTIGLATTLPDLAFIVCTALHNAGETAVLTGGGAATVYAPQAIQSRDLDFVFTFWSTLGGVSHAPLTEIGFYLNGSTYSHAATQYTLDFPMGPLAIGDEEIQNWDTLEKEEYVLHILSPTDSARDRLSAYYHWNDFSSLEQALAIGGRFDLDLELIERWSIREGHFEKFNNFRLRLRT